jgi:hypothetical protein
VAPILRFIGLLNAAVWLGGMVFFTAVVGPTFFSPEVKNLLTLPRAGAAAQIMVEHYLVLQQWCAAVALVHLISEWLYNQGRSFPKASLVIIVGCLAISLAGSRLLAPQMKQLHLVKYAVQTTPDQKASAARSFAILHGTSQVTNLLALAGVLFYFWRLSNGTQGGRPGAGARFRS